MGFDVSFHPISPEEMQAWYFTPLEWVRQRQERKVLELTAKYKMEDFYAQKYLQTLQVAADTQDKEPFDKSHGFYIAVVQGFFRDYYYTRGSAFSFLAEQKPEYSRYFTPWDWITPKIFPNPTENRIIENYSSGVYLMPKQVVQLTEDLEHDPRLRADFEQLWIDGQLEVLKKALHAAIELKCGLLEASDVVIPNPIHPNDSSCYSDLYHCDRDGVYLYIDTVMKQLAQITEEQNSEER